MNPYATTIYKLKHTTDTTKDCYIGSSNDMKSRVSWHKSSYNNKRKQKKLYGYIRENGGMDAWSFEVLEEQEFKNQYERFKREAELIDIHKAKLNTATPSATMFNPKDKRRQVCGRCGHVMHMFNNSISGWKQHHKTKQCQNAPPPVIVKGSNNTINISYMKGKKPIIIEGDNNTINIHY